MKLFAILTVMAALITPAAKATIVKGTVIDNETESPLEFVNVIVKAGNATYGATTDEKGKFKISDVPSGKHLLTASFVGYVSSERQISVGDKTLDIGTIKLGENENVLQEVEVKGVKSQMKFELDKKVFNVEADLAAAGVSASELLENIPSVEVDNDGEVSLRGNSSVTIWINGKDSGLTSDNRADILEQLPAESIDRVEIITNPSAKYSPEGTAGIINIVLKRSALLGYYGSARASANSQGGYNINGSGNFNINKWESNIGIGYRHNKGERNSLSRRSFDDGTFLNSDQTNDNSRNGVFIRGGVSFIPNEQNEIYFNGFGMFGNGKRSGNSAYSSNRPGEDLISQSTNNKGDNRGGNVTIGYKHKFTENHTLDFSASMNGWNGPQDNWMHNIYTRENADGESYNENEWQLQHNEINNRNFEYQADYSLPIANKFKFESGYKGSNSHENSPMTTYSGSAQDNMEIDADLYNRFIYEKNVQALYATIGGTIDKLSFQAGVRGEYWQIRTQSLGYGQSESDIQVYKKNNFKVFPSAFISYSFPRQNEMQVNYTRRIRRPWGGQLNSFKNTADPTNISYGNPYLEPEYSNAFELNYIKTWSEHMASVSAYYRSTDNVIQRISFINELTDVMNTTSENVSQSVSAGTEIVFKNHLLKIVDLTTTVNLFYYQLDGFSYQPENSKQLVTGNSDSNFSWNIRAMARVMLPLGFSAQVDGGYNAPTVIAQGKREASYRLNAGIRKDFGAWSINLNVRDILDSRSRESRTVGNGYSLYSKSWGAGRRFQLTVSYNFGNMKSRKKDKKDKEHQDDEPAMDSGYDNDGGED